MTRHKGPIASGQDPGGRPTLGGRVENLWLSANLAETIDERTAQAVSDGTPETQARARTVRRMLAEGGAVLATGRALPVTAEPGNPRHEWFITDAATDALIGELAASRTRSEVVRGLLILAGEYDGPSIEPARTWQDAYEAAMDGATPDQAAALRARIERPEATERQLADGLGVTVAAYKSRVQRALKRHG